ncbi:MAG: hypothetical protein COA32_04070 [Fluviicola sp.]|nr:MAG: hypothetical protein COA32_04070 [Fluviicola sp.]
MFAFLLILPTFAFVPIYFFIFPAIYIVAKKSLQGDFSYLPQSFNKINVNLLIIIAIVLASAINKWFHWGDELTILEFIPYTIATLIAFFLAKHLNERDLKIIVWLIVIEGIVVIFQYFLGVNTFFSALDHFNDKISENPDLMYNRRALGLSQNSSIAAYKFFIGYLILDYFKLKRSVFFLARIILIAGIFFTFNRTVFLVAFIYLLFSMLRLYSPIINNLLENRVHKKHIKYLLLAIISVLFLTVVSVVYYDLIINQVTRGNGIDLSGRGKIWQDFRSFISENILFGNGSEKYYVPHRGKLAHAHNSFLQVWAVHGVFILGLYLLLILRNINKRNLIFVILIVVYSLFQYGIFWGISLLDIVFFYFLFFGSSNIQKNKNELVVDSSYN